MNLDNDKKFDFFEFNKSDCLRLFKEVGHLKYSDDGLIQMKIEKLDKYRDLLTSKLQWSCVTQYTDLIEGFLRDEINVLLFSEGIVEFSNSITKKTNIIKNANEFLMTNEIILSPTPFEYVFSKYILEITEQSLSYDLNASYEQKEYLLNKLFYLHYKLQELVDDYLEKDSKSDPWTD